MKYNTNAIEIYQNMNIENIAPYMPANEIESAVFKINWCCKCDSYHTCSILISSGRGEQPTEWIYDDNKPTCTAFKEHQEKEDIEDGEYLGPEPGVIWPHQCSHRNYQTGHRSDYLCSDCGYEWDEYSGDDI